MLICFLPLDLWKLKVEILHNWGWPDCDNEELSEVRSCKKAIHCLLRNEKKKKKKKLCNQLNIDLNPSSTVPRQVHARDLAPHGCLVSVTFSPLMQQFSNKPVKLCISIGVPQGSWYTSERSLNLHVCSHLFNQCDPTWFFFLHIIVSFTFSWLKILQRVIGYKS